ncbi:glycoside hydrolase family 128 protein [Neolentinus lepideus HHB14362 ss-1]|uniref:Glycoside hydrolase family 128 protein n=1 Tax=Neolentinus lepideus HHB14362 ss-1 TaxID=1314782 RepID=A0A165N048_9AGAM|nr:glycoside hydrolase family 128 protein [Neolentinus lepideus HHB14362 ss-1]
MLRSNLLALAAVIASNTLRVLGAKRGLAWPSDNQFNPAIFVSDQVNWLYDWGQTNIAANDDFPFYIMQWNGGGIQDLVSDIASQGATVILGFNEPDNTGEANMAPADAANLWEQYIQPLSAQGITLVSPAVTNGGSGLDWMDEFIGNCTGCTMDAIAIHWYGGWTGDLEPFVESFEKYNKPIWLTEFGLSWDAGVDSYEQFLPLALEYLDGNANVEKYAFFGAFHSGGAEDMIDANGQLTALGQTYVS